jgi:L-lysine exporter family protein LysE/ArgO
LPLNFLHFNSFYEGLGTGASLIIAIGAQNAFVLKQGILRRYLFITAAVCSLIDVILITAGVLGLGAIIAGNPVLLMVATAGGSIFLVIYGIRSLGAAWKPKVLEDDVTTGNPVTLKATILALLAFSLLNPHVYLDTVLLLGSIGARHPRFQRISFIAGASTASVIWFFGLAYGSAILTPFFRKKLTWRILDLLIGCVMILISIQLIQFAVKKLF